MRHWPAAANLLPRKNEEYEEEWFVPITDAIPDAIPEIRYYSTFNMVKGGFRPLSEEWWHVTPENEPYPNTCFDFPVDMPES